MCFSPLERVPLVSSFPHPPESVGVDSVSTPGVVDVPGNSERSHNPVFVGSVVWVDHESEWVQDVSVRLNVLTDVTDFA